MGKGRSGRLSVRRSPPRQVERPAELTIGKGKVEEEIATGEKPTVEMRGKSIYCRDG